MGFDWIHENPARWDAGKARIVGGAPDGVFDAIEPREAGGLVPGEWWRAQQDGRVVGYGWMDCTWGDAEVLLAVDSGCRGQGVGTEILDRLENEAARRGVNYLYNQVRSTHPDREAVTAWLAARRFEESSDGLLKRRVRSDR